jgi:hypothetical protein
VGKHHLTDAKHQDKEPSNSMGQMCLMIYSSLITASVAFGLGKRRVDIPPDDLIRALRCLYIGQSFLLGALTFSKASFAVTLLLLPLARWKRSVLWVSLITMAMVMALCLIFLFVRCSPVRKLWDLEAPGQCWNPRAHNKFARSAGGKLLMALCLSHSDR